MTGIVVRALHAFLSAGFRYYPNFMEAFIECILRVLRVHLYVLFLFVLIITL